MSYLLVTRHGESDYNIQRQLKNEDPLYQRFKNAFSDRLRNPDLVRVLAEQLLARTGVVLNTPDTPLTVTGQMQAQITARVLRQRMPPPEIIHVSPYARTRETLECMILGWPELADAETRIDPTLREQENGVSTDYFDWRLFLTMNPEEDTRRSREGPYHYRWPGGENVPDVCQRMSSLLATLDAYSPGRNALLITHRVPKLALRVVLDGLSPEDFIDLDQTQEPINCGVMVYERDIVADGVSHSVLRTYNERLY